MKIESITLREIQMPLVHHFETSFGRVNSRRILLVTVECEGIRAWGECVCNEGPFYSEEWTDGAWAVISDFLAPALLGKTISRAAEAASLMSRVRGNRMAKAALENALWAAEAEHRRLPLWKLLGGVRTEIACGVPIGIQDSVEELLDKIREELDAGYQRIKVKVKPGWDYDVLARIRARWPEVLLSCDANSAYRLEDFDHLKRFDEFQLLMIEQPLWNDDFYFHARLQKQMQTAICLDESIHHARDAQAAAELGACRMVNIKVGRVGGFAEALRVHDLCEQHGIPVWCGGMLESGVGRAHNIALSTLSNFRLPGDVSASKRYWREDVIDPEVEVSAQGTITVSDAPGTGYRVKEDLIERLTVRKQELRRAATVSC
jgi:O-succinylbenzoate synthase